MRISMWPILKLRHIISPWYYQASRLDVAEEASCAVHSLHVTHYSLHWTKKWICSNLPMSKDVANMIANLKQMWWRPYLLTFVSKYGLHHVYPLVNIIFDTYLLICKDEQIHFFMQCYGCTSTNNLNNRNSIDHHKEINFVTGNIVLFWSLNKGSQTDDHRSKNTQRSRHEKSWVVRPKCICHESCRTITIVIWQQ